MKRLKVVLKIRALQLRQMRASSHSSTNDIAVEETKPTVWRSALKKIKSGKASRHAFWWKIFHHTAEHLWGIIRKVLCENMQVVRERENSPHPQKGCQGRPEQYQPITCLNMGYKLLIAVHHASVSCQEQFHPSGRAEGTPMQRRGYLDT